ncbi:hypothetical protein [Haloferula sp. BvORR071]|uniref:hypothetical protein n=1 Tax=Haloferula sp. BvORR071 TaxID=1396141 RepID=UPI00054D9709|nr:hypothetical protein [Haloferula sp. BvORR071]
MNSMRLRALSLCLCAIAIATAIACIVLPVIGAQGFFAEFHKPYSAVEHFKLVAEQSAGPVYTLLSVLGLAGLIFQGKRVPWESCLLALVGPVCTALNSGMVSHDFSHVVFQECSDIYGQWIDGLNVAAGVALGTLARVSVRMQSVQEPGSSPVRGIFFRVAMPVGAMPLGIAAIAEGWYLQAYTSMIGTPRILYGAACVTLGMACIGLPGVGRKLRRAEKVRLYLGLALSAVLLISAFVW